MYQIFKIMTTITAPVSITALAIIEIKKILDEKNVSEEYALRLGVEGGGCSGMSYSLGFDKPKDNDQQFEIEGVKVVMDKKHGMYLLGMEVDFKDGLDARGFTFNNPNATETCGCGDSFSV